MTELIPKEIGDFTEEKIKEFMTLESIESEKFDFKREFSDVEKDICAMANTFGGFIVIGIDEYKKNKKQPFGIYGIEDIRVAEQKAKESIVKIEPIPNYELKTDIKVDNREILIIKINESKNKPHIIKDKGQIYVRIGSHSHPASREIILKLFSDILQIKKNIIILKTVLESIKRDVLYNKQWLKSAVGGQEGDDYPTEIGLELITFIIHSIGDFLIDNGQMNNIKIIISSLNSMNGKVKNIQVKLSRGIGSSAYRYCDYSNEIKNIEGCCNSLTEWIDTKLQQIKE